MSEAVGGVRMPMWDRLTERVQHVLIAAETEAKSAGSELILPEHLFLALLRQGAQAPGLAGLVDVGVEIPHLSAGIRQRMSPSEKVPEDPQWETITRDAVMTRVEEEAKRLGHKYIGTEHLLLALLLTDSGPIREALEETGCQTAAVRQAVINSVTQEGSPSRMWFTPQPSDPTQPG
jgi:ATP-dependent Clp protease ATP-binding subunit ClpC